MVVRLLVKVVDVAARGRGFAERPARPEPPSTSARSPGPAASRAP